MSNHYRYDYQQVIRMLLLAGVYYTASKIGFQLAYVAEQVTVIWPPTGISLAAVLLLGPRIWPGILLGAFLTNLTAHEPILAALGIASGNTLEALSGAWLLRRYGGTGPYLEHVKGVLSLIFFAAAISTMISATIGVLSLCLSGLQPWNHYGALWFVWWFGDAGGTLIAAPFLLAWFQRPFAVPSLRKGLESMALALAVIVGMGVIFIRPSLLGMPQPYTYIIFPIIIWAGIRFTERAVTLITLVVTGIAIWATAHHLGPFAGMPMGPALNVLQSFTIIIGATGLIMSATMSERRRAEEGNGFLASLVESTDECIIGKTLDGTISTWNRGAEELFGYSASEAIGQNINIIIPSDRHEEERKIMAQIRKGQRTENLETVRIQKNNRRINVLLNISPIFDATRKIVGASAIGHDITGRIAAERRLLAAHQYQQTMINHIPDPIFMKDRQHRWIGGNKSFWEFMNGPPEKFIGKTDYEFFPKSEADAFWEKDDKVFNSGEVDISEEFFTDSKGERHVLSTKKVAFQDESGDPFLVGIIRDITDLKQKEMQLLKYTRELKRSNQELDDFAYIASHDLREPLRGLLTQAAFLVEDYQDKLDAEGHRRLHRLAYLSQRMEKLISDLLYFSRLGRTELAIQETDLNDVVGEIRQMMDIFLKERNARIVIPQRMPLVVCDKIRIGEVLRNLITNAVKYNDKPEPIVEVGYTESVKIPVGNEKGAFYVRDNGVGIEPQFYEAIFRIFKRLDNPSVKKEDGTGSGLTFVKKIIERHKGHIWLISEPGKGSTFYFTLGGKDI